MNPLEFEHPPLGYVVEGLANTEGLTAAEIQASLQEKGLDPDSLALRLKARVRELSRQSRLGWMQQGEAIQARLESTLRGRRSWLERKAEEINTAFNEVAAGRYGSNGQLRVQSAFSNLKEVTLESKAQFLDEVDLLLSLQATPPDPARYSVSKPPSFAGAVCRARDLISELQIQDPAEIVIEKIAAYKGAPVRFARLIGCDGRMVRANGAALITVNELITRPGQRRMIIAHELGHVLQHPQIRQIDEVDVQQTRNFNHRQQPEELEANYFAAELLMPKQFFQPEVLPCEPGWDAVKDLADRYQTTLSSAAIQFVHFTKESVMLVASDNGQRSWFVISEPAREFYLRDEWAVHRYTCVHEMLQKGMTQSRAADVPAGSWFRDFDPNGKECITEDSICARGSRFILTLLWVHDAI